MSKRIFTNEQINEISKNKNVARCSEKSITYHKDFKIEAIKQYDRGMSAKEIFKEAGFDLSAMGRDTPRYRIRDWRKTFKTKGIQGLSVETRGKGGGRPKTKWPSDKEKIKDLELQISYLKAENDFLAKLRAGKRKHS
jgi:hypothetical protein